MGIIAIASVFTAILLSSSLGEALKSDREHQSDLNQLTNEGTQNESSYGSEGVTTTPDGKINSEEGGINHDGHERPFDTDLNDHDDSEKEQDDFEDDQEVDVEEEGLLSSYSRWDVFDQDDDQNPFIDEDQVEPPEMVYVAEEEETTSVTQMEMDFFDYIEGLEEYDIEDDDDVETSVVSDGLGEEHAFENYFVSSTLPTRSVVSTECDVESTGKKKKNKKSKKKKKNPQFEIMTVGKMGKGKLMSRWQKNCCIRGRRVGNARRTFLSNNLFKECKERARSLRSRMSRSCKWIFWSCCEAKALRRFYFFTKTKKNDHCS